MKCPFCLYKETKVVDSRDIDEGKTIRRRRECLKCKRRFTSYERIEPINLLVIKRDGTREFYDRSKILNGVLKACEKRPISKDKIEKIISNVESKIGKSKNNEIPTLKIGELISSELKKVDKVAYVRFASVYKSFENLGDFEKELKTIKPKNKVKK
jgi:transcriptional repressor NrdR